jgi:hypothetical protein
MVKYLTDDELDDEPEPTIETSIRNLLVSCEPLTLVPSERHKSSIPMEKKEKEEDIVSDTEETLSFDTHGPVGDYTNSGTLCPIVITLSIVVSTIFVGTIYLVMGEYRYPW